MNDFYYPSSVLPSFTVLLIRYFFVTLYLKLTAWYLDPESASLRMLLVIGLIMSFLSYTAYSGAIVSSLATGRNPVKTFDDLVHFNFIFTVHEKSEPFKTMLRVRKYINPYYFMDADTIL